LEPNETKTVRFNLKHEHLALYDTIGNRSVEPGTFTVMMGASSTVVRLDGQFGIVASADDVSHAALGS
jgi:beta-glucosidase